MNISVKVKLMIDTVIPFSKLGLFDRKLKALLDIMQTPVMCDNLLVPTRATHLVRGL